MTNTTSIIMNTSMVTSTAQTMENWHLKMYQRICKPACEASSERNLKRSFSSRILRRWFKTSLTKERSIQIPFQISISSKMIHKIMPIQRLKNQNWRTNLNKYSLINKFNTIMITSHKEWSNARHSLSNKFSTN